MTDATHATDDTWKTGGYWGIRQIQYLISSGERCLRFDDLPCLPQDHQYPGGDSPPFVHSCKRIKNQACSTCANIKHLLNTTQQETVVT
jgi:hypothetical protein